MPSDFLQLAGKTVLVAGVANKKSVAWHIARLLTEADCRVIYSVRSEKRRDEVQRLVGPDALVLICDVEHEEEIERLGAEVAAECERTGQKLDGLVHSIAFADYEDGLKPFHETTKRAFLRTFSISCYSLVAMAGALKDSLAEDASVVAISISTTEMASENYGYMAPIKAALDSSLAFLAKSFSQFSRVRFNAVAPGLLKTSASAGIPGYVDSYLFAEKATLREEAVKTEEAAAAAVFLLSPRSSGMNAQRLVVDAGMRTNYFDSDIVRAVVERE
ncbi:enoyl-ACP reductase FabI [Botrimarina mediterranea]|uniref:Enoyl-[acyl-carrier-protein] reductase [NADH] n=1 Tax=Botrimarina mediterranea TaxID=2528022 RepID=A0A518K697_9BACT|nr:SDR family oxidoreductase [Botrimarina mediterranea]QDV73308.1 Enoyl-[acyl-carrier-protein] reductase [NADH] FabI [Botrimarina mediterranea]QDV77825.1 Enoyl-[acyl-carrier-protein] reductase [NADH] FabI [Planctomycetes bacterium K2D]